MPKCRYSHCKHEGVPVNKEDGVCVGKSYYHIDCYQEKELLREIERYYIENFDSNPIMGALRKVINTIVFSQGKTPEFLMFALRYAKSNRIPLTHEAGIYYVVRDKEIINSWNKKRPTPQFEFNDVSDLETVDGYSTTQTKSGFNRILK